MRITFKKSEEEKNNPEEVTKKPRKKKPDPPKPWGRNERLLVSSLLISTAFASALLGISARQWKLPGLPQVNVPTLGLEETYVIEADNPTPAASSSVITDFKSTIKPLSGRYGFYVVRPTATQSYGYNQQDTFQAASLVKLPVMYALTKLDLTSTHTLTKSDKIAGAGSLYYQPEGTVITYRELITLMGQESDNTAFNIATSILGEEQISTTLMELGMTQTSLANNTTTPRDIGQFFTHILEDELLLTALTDTNFEDYLPVGIPSDVVVAHKYGREVHVLADAGIVFAQEPYIVVLMSEGIVDSEAESIFPKLSNLIHIFETSQ